MKVSMSVHALITLYGLERGIKMLADAGFAAVDYPLCDKAITPWGEGIFKDPLTMEFANHFKRTAKVIAAQGLELFQSHAPYCEPNCSAPEAYALNLQQTIQAIYAAGYMECPNIVAHPVMYPDFHNGQNREQAIQTNMEFYGKMAPALKDTGVTMCIENLFWGDSEEPKPKISNACSDAGQLISLVDALNDQYGPYYAVCLDVGHAVLSGNNPGQMMRELGNRVRVLHLHDNDGIKDDHVIPGAGVINWAEFLPTIKEGGYRGTFNLELGFRDYQKDIYNMEVHQAACHLFSAVGRSMANLADGICGAE